MFDATVQSGDVTPRYHGDTSPAHPSSAAHRLQPQDRGGRAGSRVQLEKDVSNTDRFGRLLRYLWTDVGLFNEQIVRDGFATLATFPPDIKYVERIRAAQQEAYEAGRGSGGRDACVEPPPAPSQPTPTATSPAQYYYCELDPQWKSLSPAYLRSYPSEAALLAAWAGTRVKFHSSKC